MEHQIIHRDIKPQNLLLKKKSNSSLVHNNENINTFSYENYDLKIADFGLSKPLKHDEMTKTFAGTRAFMSPEVLNGHKYGKKADMWSVGCIALLLIIGKNPFEKNYNAKEAMKKVNIRSYLQSHYQLSSDLIDLVQKLLTYDRNNRIDCTAALRHPFLYEKIDIYPSNLFTNVSEEQSSSFTAESLGTKTNIIENNGQINNDIQLKPETIEMDSIDDFTEIISHWMKMEEKRIILHSFGERLSVKFSIPIGSFMLIINNDFSSKFVQNGLSCRIHLGESGTLLILADRILPNGECLPIEFTTDGANCLEVVVQYSQSTQGVTWRDPSLWRFYPLNAGVSFTIQLFKMKDTV